IFPNTAFKQVALTVVNGPTVSWIDPPAAACALKSDRLVVVANSTKKVKRVTFTDNGRRVGVDRSGPGGIFSISWKTGGPSKGRHHLVATTEDAAGRSAAAGRNVRVCS